MFSTAIRNFKNTNRIRTIPNSNGSHDSTTHFESNTNTTYNNRAVDISDFRTSRNPADAQTSWNVNGQKASANHRWSASGPFGGFVFVQRPTGRMRSPDYLVSETSQERPGPSNCPGSITNRQKRRRERYVSDLKTARSGRNSAHVDYD